MRGVGDGSAAPEIIDDWSLFRARAWRGEESGHIVVTMTGKRTIPAGKFKAECLALLDRVARTGEALVVTKRGKPVAKLVPVDPGAIPSLRGSVVVHGDIVGPVLDSWDAEQ